MTSRTPLGHADGGGVEPVLAAQQPDQLAQIEGVAPGALVEQRGEPCVRQVAPGQVGGHVLPGERRQREALRAAFTGERGHRVAQLLGVAARLRTDRRQHQHRRPVQFPGREREQAQGRRVGPVQVVEDDERRPRRPEGGGHPLVQLEQRGAGVAAGCPSRRSPGQGGQRVRRVRAEVAQHPQPGPEGGGAGVLGAAAPGDRHPQGGRLVGRRLRQAGLADARLPCHQQHAAPAAPGLGQACGHASELLAPGDEPVVDDRSRRGPGRDGRHRRGGGGEQGGPGAVEVRRLAEDGLLEPPQLGAGLQAQFPGEQLPDPAQGGEGVGLPSGPVEGEHEQAPQPLPVGVVLHQAFEVGHARSRVAERQPGLEPVLGGRGAQLGQPRHDRLGELVRGELGERLAPPRLQRGAQRLGRGGVLAPGERPPAVLGQRGEADQVHLAGRHRQQVAGLAGDQHLRRRARRPAGFERPAELGDVALQGPGRARRRLALPQLVDETVEGDHAARLQREHGQHGTLLGRAQVDGPAGGVGDLDRAEQAKVHRSSSRDVYRKSDSYRRTRRFRADS
nr:hypothetical protein [Microbispora sp. GKU 823]